MSIILISFANVHPDTLLDRVVINSHFKLNVGPEVAGCVKTGGCGSLC